MKVTFVEIEGVQTTVKELYVPRPDSVYIQHEDAHTYYMCVRKNGVHHRYRFKNLVHGDIVMVHSEKSEREGYYPPPPRLTKRELANFEARVSPEIIERAMRRDIEESSRRIKEQVAEEKAAEARTLRARLRAIRHWLLRIFRG